MEHHQLALREAMLPSKNWPSHWPETWNAYVARRDPPKPSIWQRIKGWFA